MVTGWSFLKQTAGEGAATMPKSHSDRERDKVSDRIDGLNGGPMYYGDQALWNLDEGQGASFTPYMSGEWSIFCV